MQTPVECYRLLLKYHIEVPLSGDWSVYYCTLLYTALDCCQIVTLGFHQVGTQVQTTVGCSRLLSNGHIGVPLGEDWSVDCCRLLLIIVKVSHCGFIGWGIKCRLL